MAIFVCPVCLMQGDPPNCEHYVDGTVRSTYPPQPVNGTPLQAHAAQWPLVRDNGQPNRWHEFDKDPETGMCVVCGWAEAVHDMDEETVQRVMA